MTHRKRRQFIGNFPFSPKDNGVYNAKQTPFLASPVESACQLGWAVAFGRRQMNDGMHAMRAWACGDQWAHAAHGSNFRPRRGQVSEQCEELLLELGGGLDRMMTAHGDRETFLFA
jgi:hypothetical protein